MATILMSEEHSFDSRFLERVLRNLWDRFRFVDGRIDQISDISAMTSSYAQGGTPRAATGDAAALTGAERGAMQPRISGLMIAGVAPWPDRWQLVAGRIRQWTKKRGSSWD